MKKAFAITIVMVLALTLIASGAMYDPKNEIHTTLNTAFVHGTDVTMVLDSATGFPSDGGYIRISGILTDLEWALYEYTGISTNTLTGLTPCTEGNVESTAAHTFAAASIVELINAAEYLADIQYVIPGELRIASHYADLATAVSTIGATETTLVVEEPEAITSNLTIPATMTLFFLRGGGIVVQTDSATLTIDGHMNRPLFRVFSGAGNVVFGYGAVDYLWAAWWGAKGDNSNDDGPAINLAIQSAIASRCKHIKLHGGIFKSSVEISMYENVGGHTSGLVLEGVGCSYGYGADTPSTTIVFTETITSGINLIESEETFFTGYSIIRNLSVDGSNKVTNGIYVASANLIENVTVKYCTGYGIRLGAYTNSTHLKNVNCSFNVTGLGIVGDYTTVYSVMGSNFRSNTSMGVYIEEGAEVLFSNCVIEANEGTGLKIYRVDVGSWGPLHQKFSEVHVESNGMNGGAYDGFEVEIGSYDGASGNVPKDILFTNCVLAPGAGTGKYMDASAVDGLRLDNVRMEGSAVAIANAVVLTANSKGVVAIDCNPDLTAALANGSRCFPIDVNTAGDGGFTVGAVVGATGIAFPSAPVASSDANTMDGYKEGSWTPVLTFATPGDLNVVYSYQEGVYQRAGNWVTVSYSLRTTTFTHTTAADGCQVTGLPYTSATLTNLEYFGSGGWRGITKANYTDVSAYVGSNSAIMQFGASGSGQVFTDVTAADMPTAGTVILKFTVKYRIP